MKKIFLVLAVLGLMLGITSCNDNGKFEYKVTVTGVANVLDSTAVINIHRVFTDLKDVNGAIQDDVLASDLLDYEKAAQASDGVLSLLPQKDINKLLGISKGVVAFYIYVQGYVIEPNTGIRLNIDRVFQYNWTGPVPDKPLPL
jgi:hypothetical protein